MKAEQTHKHRHTHAPIATVLYYRAIILVKRNGQPDIGADVCDMPTPPIHSLYIYISLFIYIYPHTHTSIRLVAWRNKRRIFGVAAKLKLHSGCGGALGGGEEGLAASATGSAGRSQQSYAVSTTTTMRETEAGLADRQRERKRERMRRPLSIFRFGRLYLASTCCWLGCHTRRQYTVYGDGNDDDDGDGGGGRLVVIDRQTHTNETAASGNPVGSVGLD